MESIIYVLDTNILIEAKNRYYSFDICPGFWDTIILHDSDSRIESIDYVKREIKEGKFDDELMKWIKLSVTENFFNSTKDENIVQKFIEMENWVQNNNWYTGQAKADFAKGVDGWLCAYVKAKKNRVMVTHEVYNENIKYKVKIPNICKEFDIKYVNTFEMLKELKTKFII